MTASRCTTIRSMLIDPRRYWFRSSGSCDERVVRVARPLEQPLRPVLTVIDGDRDPRGRVLGRERHQVVAALDVVVEPGHAHPEPVRHGLHRDPVEPDLGRGAGDHLAVEPRGPADLAAAAGRRADRGGALRSRRSSSSRAVAIGPSVPGPCSSSGIS